MIIWRSRKPGTKYGLRYLDVIRSIECIWYSLVLNWSQNRSLYEEWVKKTCRNVTNGLRWRLKTPGRLAREPKSGVGARELKAAAKTAGFGAHFKLGARAVIFCQAVGWHAERVSVSFSHKSTRLVVTVVRHRDSSEATLSLEFVATLNATTAHHGNLGAMVLGRQ